MSGVVFMVSVPSENYEKSLRYPSSSVSVNRKSQSKNNVTKNNTSTSKRYGERDNNNSSINRRFSSDYSTFENSQKTCLIKSKSFEKLEKNVNEKRRESMVSFCEEIDKEIPMEKELKNILLKSKIIKASWNLCEGNTHWQVTFPSKCDFQCEEILEALKENKIGRKFGSTVCVIPCNLFYYIDDEQVTKISNYCDIDDDDGDNKAKESKEAKEKDSGWSKFLTSVRARLTIAQLIENIQSDASPTFDFVCMLVIATILCAIGLVENSNVYLLSSMLVSPMMGPIMAATFGTAIRDRRLQKTGVFSAILGLGIATCVGFCYGTLISLFCDKYGENKWPTEEMVSRGELRTLRVECIIALLSGAAVTLGILGDNVASLVGVAISTSLMPPAVNAGLLWSMAIWYKILGNDSLITTTTHYSQNKIIELASLGGISICLTFVNIICIYVAGILVFKIKEVAPMSSENCAKSRFWKHDIKVARDYNSTFQNDDAKTLYEQYKKEMNFQILSDQHLGYRGNNRHHSTDYIREKFKFNSNPQYTWSPSPNNETTEQYKKPTVQELDHIYKCMMDNKNCNSGSNKKQSCAWSSKTEEIIEEQSTDDDLVINIPQVNDNNSEKSLLPQTYNNSSSCSISKARFVITPASLLTPQGSND